MRPGPDPHDLGWLIQLHLARYEGRLARAKKQIQRGLDPFWNVTELEQTISVWTAIDQAGPWKRLSPLQRRVVKNAAEDEGIDTNGWKIGGQCEA